MKAKLLVFSILLSSTAANANTPLESLHAAAERACDGNKDQPTCLKVVYAAAKFTMFTTLDYVANCANKSPADKSEAKACKDSEAFLDFINDQKKN
ncbi:TPA: hypothetical protein ACTYZ0_003575 [Citrobacter werkmanii]